MENISHGRLDFLPCIAEFQVNEILICLLAVRLTAGFLKGRLLRHIHFPEAFRLSALGGCRNFLIHGLVGHPVKMRIRIFHFRLAGLHKPEPFGRSRPVGIFRRLDIRLICNLPRHRIRGCLRDLGPLRRRMAVAVGLFVFIFPVIRMYNGSVPVCHCIRKDPEPVPG